MKRAASRLVVVWRCPTCGLRVEVQDPEHMPVVAAIHELARCWIPDRNSLEDSA